MILPIIPYVRVGPIRFGMTPAEVRAAIGSKFTAFMKAPDAEMPTDSFDAEGIHIYYENPGLCESRRNGTSGKTYAKWPRAHLETVRGGSNVRTLTGSLHAKVEEDEAGLTAFGLGIGLYAPSASKSPTLPVEGVIAFGKDYCHVTPGQAQAHPEIQKTGATVVGKGKPGYPAGTQIPPTSVNVIRPTQQ
jgi:hypothetical protein